MGLANFIHRGLGAIARWDSQDRLKGWVLAGVSVTRAFGLGGRSSSSVSQTARQQAVVKLAQYAFPAWDTPIVVIGREAEAFAAAIRASGYGRCTGTESPQGLAVPENQEAEAVAESAIVVLVDCLEWMSLDELDGALAQIRALSPARLATSIPTYPEYIWEQPGSNGQPLVVESRDWWEQRLARSGFDAEPRPRENLPGLWPHLFRRGSTANRQAARPRQDAPVGTPRTLFLMPETQNAFRWLTESLAQALTELGNPSAVVAHDSAGRQRAPNEIACAHYWPGYRDLAKSAKPGYEMFVTNFEMKPRGVLTPWVDELCMRSSIKLVPAKFCRDVLMGLGVPEDRIRIVAHGYSPEFVHPAAPLPLATHKAFRFLAVVNSHDPYRYGTDILLSAYRKAFGHDDDVCLVIKDYGSNAAATQSWFDDSGGPQILYYANFLKKSELAAFYAACSAFVAPFRGEGFGMKILDAAVAGLPLIVPLYGGPLDYCVPELVHPVAFERRPVGKCLETDQLDWKEEITWCEPSADDLAARMRGVFENRDAAAEKAARLRSIAIEQFSWQAAARKLITIIE